MKYDYEALTKFDLNVKNLGKPQYISPLNLSYDDDDNIANYVMDDDRVLAAVTLKDLDYFNSKSLKVPSFEKAGPREKLFFKPGETVSAVVTCGGLCPGLNSVIRSLVYMNYYRYNNKRTLGIRYGYEGFVDKYNHGIFELNPHEVENIHKIGGTILGSSRGPQEIGVIVDKLEELKVNVLYTIGGDGTQHGALEIAGEIERRGLMISIIGIPKTIDNDISFIDKSFGTETAFSKACEAIDSAHIEAKGAYNGIGIVKLMGRSSGFIAVNAAIASNDVNFCFIPEVKFDMDGERGFLAALKKRLERSHHAVILVAEGAGQYFFENMEKSYDASGNEKLNDIGIYMRDRIKEYFKKEKMPIAIKYIDPSYIIRSTEPTPNDSIYCLQLAERAVHAGMAGKTRIVIGYINNEFIHLPIELATSKRKFVDTEGELWLSVIEATGQPVNMTN